MTEALDLGPICTRLEAASPGPWRWEDWGDPPVDHERSAHTLASDELRLTDGRPEVPIEVAAGKQEVDTCKAAGDPVAANRSGSAGVKLNTLQTGKFAACVQALTDAMAALK